MHYSLVEITCPYCGKVFPAGKAGTVSEGKSYQATCIHCNTCSQFIWGVFYGCLSYKQPEGIALLKPVTG